MAPASEYAENEIETKKIIDPVPTTRTLCNTAGCEKELSDGCTKCHYGYLLCKECWHTHFEDKHTCSTKNCGNEIVEEHDSCIFCDEFVRICAECIAIHIDLEHPDRIKRIEATPPKATPIETEEQKEVQELQDAHICNTLIQLKIVSFLMLLVNFQFIYMYVIL